MRGQFRGGEHPAGHNLLHSRRMAAEEDRLGSAGEVCRDRKGGREGIANEAAVVGSGGVFPGGRRRCVESAYGTLAAMTPSPGGFDVYVSIT